MPKYYISFGQAHVHVHKNSSNKKTTLDKDKLVMIEADTKAEARKLAFAMFGNKWSMLYEKLPDLQYFPRGVFEI